MLNRFWVIYTEPYRKYFTLAGRARRREYWVFALVNAAIGLVLTGLDIKLGLYSDRYEIGVLSGLFALPLIIPGITVLVRRLHDSNLSGGWIWIQLIPFLGVLVTFVQTLRRGTRGENRFGPDPFGDIIGDVPADGGAPFATRRGRFYWCPWCLRTNPLGRDTCQWCHKPYREPVNSAPGPPPPA